MRMFVDHNTSALMEEPSQMREDSTTEGRPNKKKQSRKRSSNNSNNNWQQQQLSSSEQRRQHNPEEQHEPIETSTSTVRPDQPNWNEEEAQPDNTSIKTVQQPNNQPPINKDAPRKFFNWTLKRPDWENLLQKFKVAFLLILVLLSGAVIMHADILTPTGCLVQLVGSPSNQAHFEQNYQRNLQNSEGLTFIRLTERTDAQKSLQDKVKPAEKFQVWVLVKDSDFDDRSIRLNTIMDMLFDQVGFPQLLYDHVSLVVLNSSGLIQITNYLKEYMSHLQKNQAEDQTQRKTIVRRMMSNMLIENRYMQLPLKNQNTVRRILRGSEVSSSTYAWLRSNANNETFSLTESLAAELSDKLAVALRQADPNLEELLRLDELYQALLNQNVPHLISGLLGYLPNDQEKIKLMLKQRSALNKVVEFFTKVVIDGAINTYLRSSFSPTKSLDNQKSQDKFVGLTQTKLRSYLGKCTWQRGFDRKLCNREELVQAMLKVHLSQWRALLEQLLAAYRLTESGSL